MPGQPAGASGGAAALDWGAQRRDGWPACCTPLRAPRRLRELLSGAGPVLAPGAYDAVSESTRYHHFQQTYTRFNTESGRRLARC